MKKWKDIRVAGKSQERIAAVAKAVAKDLSGMKKQKRKCSKCQEDRVIVADLVVNANILSSGKQALITIKYALCRNCSKQLRGKDKNPQINLSSGGIQKRLSMRQRQRILARKEREANQVSLFQGSDNDNDTDEGAR